MEKEIAFLWLMAEVKVTMKRYYFLTPFYLKGWVTYNGIHLDSYEYFLQRDQFDPNLQIQYLSQFQVPSVLIFVTWTKKMMILIENFAMGELFLIF